MQDATVIVLLTSIAWAIEEPIAEVAVPELAEIEDLQRSIESEALGAIYSAASAKFAAAKAIAWVETGDPRETPKNAPIRVAVEWEKAAAGWAAAAAAKAALTKSLLTGVMLKIRALSEDALTKLHFNYTLSNRTAAMLWAKEAGRCSSVARQRTRSKVREIEIFKTTGEQWAHDPRCREQAGDPSPSSNKEMGVKERKEYKFEMCSGEEMGDKEKKEVQEAKALANAAVMISGAAAITFATVKQLAEMVAMVRSENPELAPPKPSASVMPGPPPMAQTLLHVISIPAVALTYLFVGSGVTVVVVCFRLATFTAGWEPLLAT